MHRAFLPLSLLLLASQLSAQAVGDSVRVRRQPGYDWLAGRIVRADSTSFTMQGASGAQEYRFADVARVDRWKRDKVGIRIFGGVLGSVAGFELGRAVAHNNQPATGSRGSDIALSAGIGVIFGLVSYAIAPGSWHRIRR